MNKSVGSAGENSKRRLFTPFERNKIRWGLACYRSREGVSWNDYHLDIRHVLGLSLDDKRITEGKDPKRFVIENINAGDVKLDLYKKFLEKVGKEYLNFNDDFEFVSIASDYYGRLCGMHRLSDDELTEIATLASQLEKYVYINIYSKEFFSDRVAHFICFRHISSTSKIIVYRFSIDLAYTIAFDKRNLKRQGFFVKKEEQLFKDFIENISDPKVLCDYSISDLSVGFAVPVSKTRFIGVDNTADFETNSICLLLKGDKDINSEINKDDFDSSIIFNAYTSYRGLFLGNGSKYLAFEIPSIQERISKMGINVL